jgi:hypothetical protein
MMNRESRKRRSEKAATTTTAARIMEVIMFDPPHG